MATEAMSAELKAKRQDYYDRISQRDMAPLWEVLKDIVPKEPKTVCAPVMWRFDELKSLVTEAAGLITAEEAERRVLVLENPNLRGRSRATQSLYAGLQLIMPGEIAGPHRHTAGAIRFILDGSGAYTQVDGEKTIMKPGDFVITPGQTAHDHGNTSEVPMIWLDVLDLPTVNFFETGFFEDLGHEPQNTRRTDGDSMVRFGSGVLPDGTDIRLNRSPIINYTYERTKPITQKLAETGDVDPCHGARVRYANPFNGGWVTPTMGAHLATLPKGFRGRDYRSTDGTIFVCAEGRGSTRVGDQTFEWGPRDIFVVPPWKTYAHRADEETVLFSISDRPAQESLGIWREERL
jgi:gentisate 1,2-dioxygenase